MTLLVFKVKIVTLAFDFKKIRPVYFNLTHFFVGWKSTTLDVQAKFKTWGFFCFGDMIFWLLLSFEVNIY
jgi:hypothetical protein